MNRPIVFHFEDVQTSKLALGTFCELGYQAEEAGTENPTEIHLHLDNNDLTSALEIAQALRGQLFVNAATPPNDMNALEHTLSGDETYDHFSAGIRL